MKTYAIVSEKKRNQTLIDKLQSEFESINWILINYKDTFSAAFLETHRVNKIFIPHWSFIIPKEIYLNYECIVFHMTDLPYGRGGSPLQNLIVRGFKETKISAIKVSKGIDTGDVYLKKDLNLEGTASQIFSRANVIIEKMIKEIIENDLKPTPQRGVVTEFKRRKPEESNLSNLSNLNDMYDYIRMLDANGYPHAFVENENFKFEFRKATFISGQELEAKVKIIKK
jgi:methionyl-tRNA formyltransferase